jgi:metal-sulfur cluster biosynthetic enzyme
MKRMLTHDEVLDLLRTVDDPEIGINIVDLGFIYEVRIDDERIEIVMGFTTSACPMSAAILQWAYAALQGEAEQEVYIDTESAPAWSPERISPAGRAELESR